MLVYVPMIIYTILNFPKNLQFLNGWSMCYLATQPLDP